jgi:hypothetical protein
MLVEALQSRLTALEEEILRVTELASAAAGKDDQDNHWRLAQDLQREARALRKEIREISEAPPVSTHAQQ